MNLRDFVLRSLAVVATAGPLLGYQVWMGTHLMRSADANDLAAWSMTASQLDGFNVNRAPHDTDPATNSEYRTIFAQFTNAEKTLTEFARSQATRDPEKTGELAFPSIASRLEEIFSLERNFGYELKIIMFYDERGTFQGDEYLYEWTETEIQYLRDWLDDNGHEDIELMWNVRNNSLRNRQLAAHPLVDSVEIEASTTALLNNTNNQITFFEWYWTDPSTANKPIALQIPRTLNSLNQFRGTRRVAQKIGGIVGYGEDGMRSDRLIFLPVTYNDNFDYLPETTSGGTSYSNTLTSIALSLMEQRSLFEGYSRVPTIADADNMDRLVPPTVSGVGDQVVSFESSTGALAYTVSDDDTAVGELTVLKDSSNTTLVPLDHIVIGGSGGNRTVEVIPEMGQSGTAKIELWVSDGTLATPIRFTVTVLPSGLTSGTMLSEAADCSVTENPSIEKLSSATVDVGARGNSPWVERCTVYVFQLPDLGAVVDPFQEADFTFEFVNKSATIRGYDLYGLGRRASSAVLKTDFYSQSSSSDPTDATRIQQTIFNNNTPVGLVSTTDGGDANLVSYLNEQYAGGAGSGEYVFLRINTRAPKSGLSYATLTMAEGGLTGPEDTRPRISYQVISGAPTISSIADQPIIVGEAAGALPFSVGDADTPLDSLMLSGSSSNSELLPASGIAFGGGGSNRTVTLTPNPGVLGSTEITIQVSDGMFTEEETFTLTVDGFQELVAGWDQWGSSTTPAANLTGGGILATAVASGASGNWSISDDGNSGRGSSGDGTWGSFDGGGMPASATTSGQGANMTVFNGMMNAEITFTITNNGSADWDLKGFHMDVVAFRPNAPRSYELEVLSGDITNGVVMTSGDDEITHLGGTLTGSHDDHDDIDVDLAALEDSTLEPGETAELQIRFSSGTGSGGGHHLFLDNVAISGVTVRMSGLESWRLENFGTVENAGEAADSFDADGDGEINLMEFATGQDPQAATIGIESITRNGGDVEVRFARSKVAVEQGVVILLEWSDSLRSGSWRREGIPEVVESESPELQRIRATLPAGEEGRKFVRHLLDPQAP